jgi:RNA polymerase sigma-70 factor, ECF subfamily
VTRRLLREIQGGVRYHEARKQVNDSRSDEQLLRDVGTDPDAFEEFYRRHVGKVVGFAVRRCSSAHEVADLVSTVFLAAVEAAPRFDPELGRPISWLLGIAAKERAKSARQRGREANALARLSGADLLDDADLARLEEQIDAARLAPGVRTAISALPSTEREMIELTTFDGLTPADAAAALHIRPSTARMRLNRGRKKLRRALQRTGADSRRRRDHQTSVTGLPEEACG